MTAINSELIIDGNVLRTNISYIKNKLESMLEREKRQELASEIFKFIPTRVKLDLLDWKEVDIFSH